MNSISSVLPRTGALTCESPKLCHSPVFLRYFVCAYIFVILVVYPFWSFWGLFGPLKILFMAWACFLFLTDGLYPSKAFFWGLLYWSWQMFAASLHPEGWRWSTLFFSAGFVFSYVSIYNMIYFRHIFTIDTFLPLVKWFMMIFFVCFIMQQACLIIGIHYAPVINLYKFLNRGWGAPSLSIEPSHFARYMIVCYYTYLKASEYKRGKDRFSLKELFTGEHRWITIRFLWMMTTMGSGTAYGCLIVLAGYFVTQKNFKYMVPLLILCYIGVQYLPQAEQMERATKLINATVMTGDVQVMKREEGSGASRLSPLINSFNADFSKFETWFGHGIDYTNNKNGVVLQTCTLFDDYGFIFWLLGFCLSFFCSYRIWSLGAVFCLMGVGGGTGTNIFYTWTLALLMTCERYFYEQTQLMRDSSPQSFSMKWGQQ